VRAHREHVHEGALRDDEVPLGVVSLDQHDRQALPQKVVGDLVDLGVAGGREAFLFPGRDDRRVDRVVDGGLEGGVEEPSCWTAADVRPFGSVASASTMLPPEQAQRTQTLRAISLSRDGSKWESSSVWTLRGCISQAR
jgi:hypothetical protein